jgi:hypothetical protein
MFARIAARTGVQLPSPPVFARNAVESESCRTRALAQADVMGFKDKIVRGTIRQAGKVGTLMPAGSGHAAKITAKIRQSGIAIASIANFFCNRLEKLQTLIIRVCP